MKLLNKIKHWVLDIRTAVNCLVRLKDLKFLGGLINEDSNNKVAIDTLKGVLRQKAVPFSTLENWIRMEHSHAVLGVLKDVLMDEEHLDFLDETVKARLLTANGDVSDNIKNLVDLIDRNDEHGITNELLERVFDYTLQELPSITLDDPPYIQYHDLRYELNRLEGRLGARKYSCSTSTLPKQVVDERIKLLYEFILKVIKVTNHHRLLCLVTSALWIDATTFKTTVVTDYHKTIIHLLSNHVGLVPNSNGDIVINAHIIKGWFALDQRDYEPLIRYFLCCGSAYNTFIELLSDESNILISNFNYLIALCSFNDESTMGLWKLRDKYFNTAINNCYRRLFDDDIVFCEKLIIQVLTEGLTVQQSLRMLIEPEIFTTKDGDFIDGDDNLYHNTKGYVELLRKVLN